MLKRLAIMGALTGVAALAAGSVAPATGQGPGRHGDDDEFSVISNNTEEAFVDVGEPDISLGDAFVFTSRLTKEGRTVGRTGVECTVTSVEREETQCLGSAAFGRGQITIQGLLRGEPERFSFAITGGTGHYEGVGGTLFVREIGGGRERLTFDLEE